MQDPRIHYLSKDTTSSVSADEAIVQDQDDSTCKQLLAPEVSKYYALRSPALDIVIQKYAVYITSNAAWSLVMELKWQYFHSAHLVTDTVCGVLYIVHRYLLPYLQPFLPCKQTKLDPKDDVLLPSLSDLDMVQHRPVRVC